MTSAHFDNIRTFKKQFGIMGIWKAYSLFSPKIRGLFWKKSNKCKLKLKKYNSMIELRPHSTDNLVLKYVLMDGQYDILWKENLIKKNSPVIIDAGANIGDFCIVSKYFSPDARIIAVEPDEENYELLRRNTRQFENIECLKAGIWKKDSFLRIASEKNGKWGITVEECTDGAIFGRTIPSIMEQFGIYHIDLLKMDIEGSEMEVFSSENDAWIDRVDVFVVEIHENLKPGVTELINVKMKNKGYKYIVNHEDVIFYREGLNNEKNFICH